MNCLFYCKWKNTTILSVVPCRVPESAELTVDFLENGLHQGILDDRTAQGAGPQGGGGGPVGRGREVGVTLNAGRVEGAWFGGGSQALRGPVVKGGQAVWWWFFVTV